jgi:hypothetical protein
MWAIASLTGMRIYFFMYVRLRKTIPALHSSHLERR